MAPKLILMFTLNDVTVPDAQEHFEMVKDLDVDYFGFKEIGLPEKEMKKLAIYSISVVFIFSVCVRAEEIQPGEYKTGYIGVDQNDTYTFYANAGDVVTILMGEADGGA